MRDILVVDDDPEIVRLLRELLEAEGYRVASARNGREALRYLTETPGELLILLDLMMPEMDGYAMLSELAREPTSRSRCRIIVMSASARLDAGGLDGADAALSKPFDLLDLLDLVDVLARDGVRAGATAERPTLAP